MNILVIFCAQYLYILSGIIALICFLYIDKKTKIQFIKLSLLAAPIIFVVSKVLNHIIKSPRPFIINPFIHPLIHASNDNGFPSDHTLLTMTIAAIVFSFNKKLGILLAAIALCVGVARVLAHVHHPIDVIGAIIIAVISTMIASQILRKLRIL